jgi:hypothetical protein
VNGCTGKMGLSVAEAAVSRGLHLVPVSISSREQLDRTVQIGQIDVWIYGPSEREDVLSSLIDEFPDVIIVNYTTPDSVNCKQFNIAVFFSQHATITLSCAIMGLQFQKFPYKSSSLLASSC